MASRSIAKHDLQARLDDGVSVLRGAARIAALVVVTLFCVLAHLTTQLIFKDSGWPRRFLGWVAAICGAVIELRGEPLQEDVLFVSNHSSWLDIPIIAGATGTAFVSNAGVAEWPLIGWLASLNNTVFVDRTDRAGVQAQIMIVRRALNSHQPVTVFPEGTTSNGRDLLPFKPSLLEVVTSTPREVRVQPLHIDYGSAQDIAWIGTEPAARNARRVLTRPGRFTVRLNCLEPFDPAEIGDRKAVAAESRRRILAASARSAASV
jgi:1-acyl-sn-glycerol-3-phosphate acyltransferase